ncbi:cupin domain-containing protein [Cryobacterium sp. TMT2-15-1]|uniref:cupin domain-containing protein n=1 Tax=Cryobacterium sp. TMT2-15-1 TaxID=1259246 RepID=UPI0018E086E0|nr:cupin domain-containing protein [Cryobacterium sp. TMT2-15-1]
MNVNRAGSAGIRVKTARDIESTGDASALDRYLIDSADSGGAIAVVEHLLAPRTLAAPIHRHSREDEYSLVLAGRLGVFEDGDEVVASPGDLVFKPRGRWHTFWNAGEEPLRVLELIVPGGIEQLFRQLAEPGASTTRQRFRRWRPNTAARSTSRPPCP